MTLFRSSSSDTDTHNFLKYSYGLCMPHRPEHLLLLGLILPLYIRFFRYNLVQTSFSSRVHSLLPSQLPHPRLSPRCKVVCLPVHLRHYFLQIVQLQQEVPHQ